MTKCFGRARPAGGWPAIVIAALLQACSTTPPTDVRTPSPPPQVAPPVVAGYERANWSAVPGWFADEVTQAWPALTKSCQALRFRPEWSVPCSAAAAVNGASPRAVRDYFDRYFEPHAIVKRIGPAREDSGLMTGYYEPLLQGSRVRTARFVAPLYAPPADLLTIDLATLYPELKGKRVRGRLEGNRVVPYFNRAELETSASLAGREIVWVDDVLDAFLLQIQGSGRVQLTSGETIRLQYADQNGHPYQSIGRYLVDRGELTLEEASLPGIRRWLDANPGRLKEVLDANPSFVFFNEEKLDDPAQGPKGSQGLPLTSGRSVAVDPGVVPLGTPVFLDTTYPATDVPLQRLVIAQDTGGAIRGPVRADFFWGSGHEAGELAGRTRQKLRMWMLWPKGVPLPGG